jgi:L-threonylcarbamoyladenylate synthase
MHTELGKDIQRALELLQEGKQVAVPTETVYGLAADANHEEAVLGIFAAKNRPHANPLILHFDCLHSAEPYMLSFPAVFKQLYASFCPGPLTFIVPKSSLVSELITGGQDTVAIRFPKHEVLQNLLQSFGRPLAAPSANLYGQLSPTTAQHVFSQLNGRIPYILDGGACDQGLESTIIGLENERVLIYRYGSITAEQLAVHLGYAPEAKIHEHGGVRTSGMVKYHYATQTPLYLGFKNEQGQDADLQILLTDDQTVPEPKMILSQSGSLTEAAQNLYAMLHAADAIGVERIFVEPFPQEGLGAAMNDRLSRAAAKFTSKA